MRRVIKLFLGLTAKTLTRDWERAAAVANLEWATDVIVIAPTWQECPNAATHDVVEAINRRRIELGQNLVWGRTLYVQWGERGSQDDHYSPAFLTAALTTLEIERQRLGAHESYLDAEGTALSLQKILLKEAPVPLREAAWWRMARAMQEAAAAAPAPATWVHPSCSGSSDPNAWQWATQFLARPDAPLWCPKTYYVFPPNYKMPKLRPPADRGCRHNIGLWGCHVASSAAPPVAGQPTLSIDELLAMRLEAMRSAAPEASDCQGLAVYFSNGDFRPGVAELIEKTR